ncbi:u-box domain-containing protein 9 [Quercus suber]|uniref:U-box domain-containing protein 9 n=1 Tax=Quercus suber TaxID=58331 RepID=A0AAW0L523_QUESU
MAKTDVNDFSDPTVMAKVTELKKELQRLVKAIVDDDEDCSIESIDEAKEKLCALKELKQRRNQRSLSLKLLDSLTCPEEFRCPLSKELMRDPISSNLRFNYGIIEVGFAYFRNPIKIKC